MSTALQQTDAKPPTVAGASLITLMAARFNLEPQKFLSTLIKTVFPSTNQTPSHEQVAAFLTVAREYDLNPFIKEIYAFPGKGGGIVPIVSIDGWSTLINRQSALDGIDFEDKFDNEGSLVAVTTIIYRKDRTHPTRITEYMKECVRNTDTWAKYPIRMLRHKSLIQCARVAFGLAGIYDPDEAERIAEAEQATAQIAIGSQPSKTERMAAQLANHPAVAGDVIDVEPETQTTETEAKAEPVDEKKEAKRLRTAIEKKFKELEWTEKRQSQFLGGKDIYAFKLDQLVELNDTLTEELAKQG